MGDGRSTSLVDILCRQAGERPDAIAYRFVDGEHEVASLTHAALDARARAIAAELQRLGLRGERALLLYPPGLDFIAAFFGCLYAGTVAVPVYLPRLNRPKEGFLSIVRDARPRVVLALSSLRGEVEPLLGRLPGLEHAALLCTDGLDDRLCGNWADVRPQPDDLAFLQYTSGSTSRPKGVMVSHGNLMANEETIRRAFDQSTRSVIVGWLPLYHDMGLIGNVLQPLYAGASCVLMSPLGFLKRPVTWLRAIHRYRGTTSGGPNFAYELCATRISEAEREGLDLSSWRVAFNGAEPVRRSTMEAFAAAFSACGFRAAAFYPCYGLAEATLFVTGGSPDSPPVAADVWGEGLERGVVVPSAPGDPGRRSLTACGRTWTGHRVVVADPETCRELPSDRVGEIWVAGPSVARGYWERPEETAATFEARLATGEGPFLRTGDLGFLREGELFVTGRAKDLIILRGRNLYPQDLEWCAEVSHPALRPGCSAAFHIEAEDEERLVIAVEVRREEIGGVELAAIAAAVRQAVAEEHEAQVWEVALLPPGAVPKTSSGKIRRSACRAAWLDGSLHILERDRLAQGRDICASAAAPGRPGAPATAGLALALDRATLAALPRAEVGALLSLYLRQRLPGLLGIPADRLSLDQPLLAQGLDSLRAVELQADLEARLGAGPTLACLLEGASAQQAVAEALGRLDAAPPPPVPAAIPSREDGRAPLSLGQRALWFLSRLAPESPAYHIAGAARVRSRLDPAALEISLTRLAARHGALRTEFHEENGVPFRRVRPAAEAAVEVVAADLSGSSEEAVAERLHAEIYRPFDLQAGALLRAVVLARGEEDCTVGLAVHHIVADFTSLGVLLRELREIRLAAASGEEPRLAPPAATFDDVVERERAWLASPRSEASLAWWRERLAGSSGVLDLPTDRPRQAVQTWEGASINHRFDAALSEALRRAARDRGTTLFTILLAGFQALLSRLSAQDDLVVGSPWAGRATPDLSGVVGYLVNPLVLRADLLRAASFAQFVDRTKESVLGALEHQECPFPLLVERLQPERDPSRSPLFQAMIVLQRSDLLPGQALAAFALGEPGAELDLGGLPLESIRFERRGAQLDLSLAFAELGGGLGVCLEFNTALFDRATARRLLGWQEVLLRAAVADPRQPPQALPLLTPAERDELIVERNRTRADHPGGTLHGLVAERAARKPGATALIDGVLRLTRGELEERANRLAHHLRALGVGPEDRVGVCLPRDWRLLASLLGILKAGGAYVPLDPSYPQQRLQTLLEDARPKAVLAVAGTAARLAGAGVPVLDVGDWSPFASSPDTPPAESGPQTRLAYVIYTSGSTGRPKGVAIAHSSAVALLRWAGEAFTPREWAGTLASTSVGFDLSVFEIFGPLAHGGAVILAENALHLPELPAAAEVTLVNTVPSAMTELVRNRAVPDSVRTVNLAGEPFGPRLVEEIFTATRAGRLLNLYGPSEDTTYSTIAPIERGLRGAPPIGAPIANTQAYVVGRGGLELLPSGVPGELLLGGAGLARGYLFRPDLTAERFVPDPFSGNPGARLYRTGDLVVRRPGGALEFLGRLDQQVKIRGFRIELEEVASQLAEHPEVAEAVVLARPAEGRLAAYVVPAGPAPAPAALQGFLRERLPAPMVPAVFAFLQEMPRTPNGKIDRRALAAVATVAAAGGEAVPGSLVEELLAGIWSDLLGLERVGVDDDFFALGGHSLLATQVVSRVREAFGVDLPVRVLFEAPTVAALARRIDRPAGERAELPPLVPVSRTDTMPASFAQQRLWLLDQREPGNAAYNVPEALRLRGRLDLAALRRSFDEVARRHESLRTTFAALDGVPVQVIAPPRTVALPRVDLQGLPEERREAEVLRLALAESRQPFDLARGPLLRLHLFHLGAEEHVVLVTMHHVVSDGWSMGLLTREMTRLYRAQVTGMPADLPELPVQYADFAVWQRAWLQGELLESQLDHWRRHLAGVPSVLELPTDRPRPRVQTFRGAHLARALPAGLTAAVRSFSRREGATLFMTFLAAFESLMARQSGQPLFAVGTPIANRRRSELERIIGFFVNTLVLRAELVDDPSFAALLARVRETALDAYAHQDVPFEKLVEALQPERSLSYSPLFQVLFVQHNAPRAALDLEGLALEPLGIDNRMSKFDLSLSILENGEGLAVEVEYNTDLFDRTSVERLLGHYERLLAAATEAPAQRVSGLPLLASAERFQSLVEWNDSALEEARERCIHHCVEAQVARTPDATAVVFEGSRLSYRELNVRANQLAAHLESLGVRPGDRVGLCVERSLDLPVSLLGILKAGAVYVPLDPEYPRDRLLFMLEDSGVAILLTQQGLQNLFTGHPIRLVYLDIDIDAIFSGPGEDVDRGVRPDMPGYALYTSGSTGQPKGVLLPHRGIANHIQWKQRRFPLAADDRVLQKTRIGFDASLWEFFYAWTAGAELVLARPGGHRDTAYLANLIADEGITVFQFVPSVLRIFLEEPAVVPGRVRRVFSGGEALAPDLVRKFSDRFPVELANVYGPTEISITCSLWVAQPGEAPETVPIGRPITNDELFVLDRAGEPVPVGTPGELHVGGAGLASGYIGRPDLTAERFVPHPFAARPGERLYRTGDVVRSWPDGNLELVGRVDDQVKIRGFRIEPGEVESLLAQHPGVRESVVVVWEDEPGEKVLVAYVVAGDGGAPSPAELSDFLKLKLPDYMIPAAFVALAQIPLNPNGKLDRAALPAPDLSAVAPEKVFIAPRDPVEEMLAAIWSEVLHQERVSVLDNFFDLGGHSLLATQVNSRIAQTFQVELPLEDLFAAPTLEELAQRIGRALKGDADLPVPPITRRPEGLPRQLSFAQERLWIVQQLVTVPSVYNTPALLRLGGALETRALRQSLSEIARRHEVVRTTFHASDGLPEARLADAAEVPMELLDLRTLDRAERKPAADRWIAAEASRPFDLERGPLFRTALCRLEENEHLLLLNLHHIVCDGWSMGLLVREMAALYEAFAAGAPSPLPEPAIQYSDVAHWQREWLQGEALARQLAYWRSRLAGAPPVLSLPLDRPRPAQPTYSGDLQVFELSADLLEGLQSLSRGQGATLFMTTLAGFALLLARISAEVDVSLGTPIAGRNRVEIEPLVGFFVNTLVIRTDLAGDPSFRELVGRVRTASLGAFAHQDVPFEKLVVELHPERSLSTTPLFQVMFALQNVSQEIPRMPGLELGFERLNSRLTKFDLTLALGEGNQGRLASLQYNTDLFDAATASRLVEQLQILLAGVVADPCCRLSELPLLSEAHRRQLIAEWSDTEREPAAGSLVELFAAQARRAPEAVAVIFEPAPPAPPQRLTFAELDAASDRLAWALRAEGVGPEEVVALYQERGPGLVTAMLAVLKAGGAFVPLAPSDPPRRIEALLADVRPRVLLTQSAPAPDLELPPAVRLVRLDRNEPAPGRSTPRPLAQGGARGDLAYVLYTSGSTGQPKGVQITHGSLLDYLQWIGETLAASGVRRIPWITRPVFDACLKQIFVPLLRGEAVWILPEESVVDVAALLRALDGREQVGLNCVPPLWQAMVEVLERGEAPVPAGLVCLLLGGERLSEALVSRTRRLLPGIRILNLYGPTEATANASWAEVEADGPVTLGRPLPRHALRLLDVNLQPVPPGVVGELFIGGHGLARGYLGRPDLTAAAFLPDPWGEPGARMYRTGDRARVLPGNGLQLQGRADLQVKIRGQRIEIEEIEAVLALHPAVRECCVLVQDDPDGGPSLIAAVVLAEPAAAVKGELGDFLAERLPAALVPAVALLPEPLPRLSSGKVDRRGLARRGVEVQGSDRESAAPRTASEEIVAGIFSEVLGAEGVGPRDNFFDLGGHSLLAVRIVSRLRQVFRTDLPLRALFEAPTVERLARILESSRGGAAPASIEPRTLGDRAPLSFAQHRLWFLDQMIPGSSMYNIPYRVELDGPLSRAALELCLVEILRRHEALRTTFLTLAGEPYQAVSPVADLVLPLVDLTGLVEADVEVERLAIQEAGQAFDLRTGRLARFRLLRVGDDRHHLLCTLHHIVADGWSMEILLRELAALYAAFADSRPSPLPGLPVQYADFAAWQRERWSRGELRGQLEFWRDRLAGTPPLELPADGRRSDAERPRAAAWTFTLPAELGSALAGLGRRQGATRFMSFLAALQALLGRLSGQADFAVGSPVAGREHRDIEGLIGFFVNTLVLRCDLADGPTFAAHLERVRSAALEAYQNQELPFEKLVEELQPERRLGQTPLFQILFAFQAGTPPVPPPPGLRWAFHQPPATAAKFDLSLVLREQDGLVTGQFEHRADLFSTPAIQRLAGQFQTLLAAAAADPLCRLGDLPLLAPAELEQVLAAGNGAAVAYPRQATVPELVAEWVQRTPGAVALTAGDLELTYCELDRRANAVARRLRELGVGPETPVAVCAERSPALVVGVLGVLKAGGFYVPLDPDYPEERLAFMLEDAGAPVLVRLEHLAAPLRAGDAREVVLTAGGEIRGGGPASSEPGPVAGTCADNLAYVMYTSGSTGKPKGVGVVHRGIVRLVRGVDYAAFGPPEVWLQVSTPSFDAATLEIWGALINGGRLVLMPPGVPSPAEVSAVMARHGVTSALLTAALFQRVVEEGLGGVASLRQLLSGGDVVAPAAVRRAAADLPGCRLVNAYGPTENTVITCCHDMTGTRGLDAGVPLGRPIANTWVRLLDRHLQPIPEGIPGELFAAGDGLARGYWGRPDLTAERFLPDPWSPEPGGRMYRTGDRARSNPAGAIEFLGRVDHQVKIRGFRIEPGEIEAALVQHSAVRDAVVKPHEHEPGGDRYLVAYVAAEGEDLPASGDLRTFLGNHLPAHMVPTWFVVQRELPLTPSGKIDRGALHLPRELREPGRGGFVAPRSMVEQAIADIWMRVLQLERVGVFDSFFELGGHSLNATQVVSQLREELGVEVPLRTLFQTPTVADLAVSILKQMAGEAGDDLLASTFFGDPGETPSQAAVQNHPGEPQ